MTKHELKADDFIVRNWQPMSCLPPNAGKVEVINDAGEIREADVTVFGPLVISGDAGFVAVAWSWPA